MIPLELCKSPFISSKSLNNNFISGPKSSWVSSKCIITWELKTPQKQKIYSLQFSDKLDNCMQSFQQIKKTYYSNENGALLVSRRNKIGEINLKTFYYYRFYDQKIINVDFYKFANLISIMYDKNHNMTENTTIS